jgi:hypothetical protein
VLKPGSHPNCVVCAVRGHDACLGCVDTSNFVELKQEVVWFKPKELRD